MAIIFISGRCAFSQNKFSIDGSVKDIKTLQPLSGANINLKNNTTGTVSNNAGKFNFYFDSKENTAIIQIKYIGYVSKEIKINSSTQSLEIYLQPVAIMQNEVEISESKIPQHILESPVTVIKVDSKTIQQLPNENYYAGLATQKGVDVSSNSLFYKSFNLRGFSSPLNESVLQLIDGVDNIAPGQGFTPGNLAGENDIDVDNVEIIPGSSTAIYGANSFNGLIYIHTKDPFLKQGFSFQIKNGCNLINNSYHGPAMFTDYQARYAKAWNNRFAFKISIGYLSGKDWLQESKTDYDANASDEIRGVNNPGRDLANIYGDEVQQELPIGPNGTNVFISRTGYNANEILGITTTDLKIRSELHYKPTIKSDLSYQFNYSFFNSNVGYAFWNLRNFRIVNHKIELKGENYFIRAYSIRDHDGNSYDAMGTAIDINYKWKNDSIWFDEFTNAYNGVVADVTSHNFQSARNYADKDRPLPGSELFNQLHNEFSTKYITQNGERGDRFADRSGLYKALAQYDFSNLVHPVNIICGVDFGSRYLISDGTMFSDTIGGDPIVTKNYSAYVQAKKDLFNEKLILQASVRIDKFTNYSTLVTPRIASVLKINSKNYLRISYQNGSRIPDPFNEYSYWHWDIYSGIGALESTFKKYHLINSSFDYFSWMTFKDSTQAYLDQHGQSAVDTAAELYKHLLKPYPLKQIQPEKINSFEIGYQSLLFKNKIHIDVAFFFSIYDQMIMDWGTQQPLEGNDNDSLHEAAVSFINDEVNFYYFSVNYSKRLYMGGTEMSIEYNFYKNFVIGGNATLTKSSFKPDSSTSGQITDPPFRTNLGLSNSNVYRNIGFNINWRWQNSIGKYYADINPHINNNVKANNIIDGQISYAFTKINTVFRIGASNLLNHYYSDEANAASIGGVYYFSVLYNVK